MVSSDIEQHNGVKSGHTLQLELQDMLNSHDMNPVLGSKGDELKVGSKQQEQLHLSPKLNFLNALKGSDVDENKGRMSLDMNPVRNLHFAPPAITDGRVTVAPPLDVFEDGCELWKSTLVGHFVGQNYPILLLILLPKEYGAPTVYPMFYLLIMVSFSSLLILSIAPLMFWREPHGTWPTDLWCLNVGIRTCNF